MSNNFNTMPPPPAPTGYQHVANNVYEPIPQPYAQQYNQQQYYQQPYPQQGYYPQQNLQQYYAPQPTTPIAPPGGLGASFKNLIGTNVTIPINSTTDIVPAEKSKRKRKSSSKDDGETTEVVTVKQEQMAMVEETSYAATYDYTNQMIRSTISQVDELSADLKYELDKIRAASPTQIKGKYTYLANLSSAMTGLLGTKVTAIRELNSSIRNVNEAEYRRYKDGRAADAGDDSKYIMDMYNAYIQNPIGTLPGATYSQPNTLDITSGLNGVVRVDAASPAMRDAGYNGFMNNLSPEQNAMIQESNPNVEEVIVYDQSTGKKYFDWRDMSTGKHISNMPMTDQILMEDYAIDPRTRIAKNVNINDIKKVVYDNENSFNEY